MNECPICKIPNPKIECEIKTKFDDIFISTRFLQNIVFVKYIYR